MAERIHKRHQDDIRAKIQASVLIDMLTKLAVENKVRCGVKGSATGGNTWRAAVPEDAPLIGVRVRAALGLLNKTLPDLTKTEYTGDGGGPLTVQIVRYADSPNSK